MQNEFEFQILSILFFEKVSRALQFELLYHKCSGSKLI